MSSRASFAKPSRQLAVFFATPASSSRKKRRLSFASFLQIFTRIRKSFLLRASSASIQLAATDPDARTNCRTSSALLRLLGNCLTNVRTDSANRNVRSSRSRRLASPSILKLEFCRLFGIWDLGFGICGCSRCNRFLRCISEIVRCNQSDATFFQQLLSLLNVCPLETNDQRHR